MIRTRDIIFFIFLYSFNLYGLEYLNKSSLDRTDKKFWTSYKKNHFNYDTVHFKNNKDEIIYTYERDTQTVRDSYIFKTESNDILITVWFSGKYSSLLALDPLEKKDHYIVQCYDIPSEIDIVDKKYVKITCSKTGKDSHIIYWPKKPKTK